MADGESAARSGDGVGRALLRLLVAIGRAIARGVRRLRAWNRRGGAGASGLAQLVETHALQAAGDATVAVALAGTLFFSVPTHQARTRVALYLIVTMAPFAVVAPVLGPLLDRFRAGRRLALAASMAARATLAIVIGHSLHAHGAATALALYPAALGVLVAGKAYNIARSAAVPRLVPPGMTLVQANARLTLAAVVSPGLAGALAVGLSHVFGVLDALRVGAVFYVLAAVLAVRLPRAADGGAETRAAEHKAPGGLRALAARYVEVRAMFGSTLGLRWLAGFLLLYGAFVVREHPIGGLSGNVALGALAIGIGAGNALGTVVGARTARAPGRRLAVPLLGVALAVAAVTALHFGLLTVFALAVASATTAAVSKLGLDATIQRRADDDVRTSTFGRSETSLQLAWVVGGAVGILLPTRPAAVGFWVATAVLALALCVAVGLPVRRPKPAGAES